VHSVVHLTAAASPTLSVTLPLCKGSFNVIIYVAAAFHNAEYGDNVDNSDLLVVIRSVRSGFSTAN